MKKAEPEAGGAEPLQQERTTGRAPGPAARRRILREQLGAAYESILAGFIEKAREGGSQHMKMTTDLLETTTRGKGKLCRGPSTVERLLKASEDWGKGRSRSSPLDRRN